MSIRTRIVNIWQGMKRIFLGDITGKGERVDINLRGKPLIFDRLDSDQKAHYRRYEYARSVIKAGGKVADLACGTGYGSMMLVEVAEKVTGVDRDKTLIKKVQQRYRNHKSVEFICADLLSLGFDACFDAIVSFETIEHFEPDQIPFLFGLFYRALKPDGLLIFSTPYKQDRSPQVLMRGFHHTFDIDENQVSRWLEQAGFKLTEIRYQNYETYSIEVNPFEKVFIICMAHVKK